jgi:hypothetical protein
VAVLVGVELPNRAQRLTNRKTEGLELGAVDKLLFGLFVGCDGEEETSSQLTHPRPSYLFFQLLSNNNVRFRIRMYILSNRISINSWVRILDSYRGLTIILDSLTED